MTQLRIVAGFAVAFSLSDTAQAQQTALSKTDVPPSVALASLPVLKNLSKAPNTVEVNITAAPARLTLQAGKPTDVYAYNGSIPGPTLELREGDRVIVHFKNNLSEPTTIHWHGLHIPVKSDGSPLYLVEPGKTYDYVFTIERGTAGTYWYHPHPHHDTGFQIGKGLFGAIVIRADDDPLPKSLTEKLIILADNRFLPDGSLDFSKPGTLEGGIDFNNGREGPVMFVNGQIMPTINIRSGEVQRWRVINASAARVYRLAIPGHRLLHVGTDGGLFENPVDTTEIILANSERAEFLVRGTAAPGTVTRLQSLPYDRYVPQTRPENWKDTQDLAVLKYSSQPAVVPAKIPAKLRFVPPLDTMKVTERRVLVMTQGFINGKTMDPDRVDITAKLDATEIWELENLVGMDHPFHLHGFQFQVLDRNGVPEKSRRWKDTVNVPKHETARFIVRFADHAGKWMFHCHILDHEDHGMMGVLEVK